jgi:cysteine desulfuration protein SufE
MIENNESLPPELSQIVSEFAISESSEKVELLLSYALQMPSLPERLQYKQPEMDLVEECMTPVHVMAETREGKMSFYFDVPQESPTVRGFAAVMALGLEGATPEQVLAIPNDFFYAMGLERVLSMQRLNGMSAILAHVKRLAAQALEH